MLLDFMLDIYFVTSHHVKFNDIAECNILTLYVNELFDNLSSSHTRLTSSLFTHMSPLLILLLCLVF